MLSQLYPFLRSFACSFVRSFGVHSVLVRSFTPSLAHSLIRSFVRSLIRSFVHLFVNSFVSSFLPSFVRSSLLFLRFLSFFPFILLSLRCFGHQPLSILSTLPSVFYFVNAVCAVLVVLALYFLIYLFMYFYLFIFLMFLFDFYFNLKLKCILLCYGSSTWGRWGLIVAEWSLQMLQAAQRWAEIFSKRTGQRLTLQLLPCFV